VGAIGEAGHARGCGPSVITGDAVGATHDGTVEAMCGAAVGAAGGRNPGGTAGTGRGATRGPKPGGMSEASRQGTMVEVPVVVSRVPMVKTVEPDSQRKSRSVGLGEAVRGKLSSSKNHMSRDDHVVCREIKVAVAFVISGVA
jgi:hypothetical protein